MEDLFVLPRWSTWTTSSIESLTIGRNFLQQHSNHESVAEQPLPLFFAMFAPHTYLAAVVKMVFSSQTGSKTAPKRRRKNFWRTWSCADHSEQSPLIHQYTAFILSLQKTLMKSLFRAIPFNAPETHSAVCTYTVNWQTLVAIFGL